MRGPASVSARGRPGETAICPGLFGSCPVGGLEVGVLAFPAEGGRHADLGVLADLAVLFQGKVVAAKFGLEDDSPGRPVGTPDHRQGLPLDLHAAGFQGAGRVGGAVLEAVPAHHVGVLTTRSEDAIYVHCPEGLTSGTLPLRPLRETLTSVTLLNAGQDIAFTTEPVVYQRSLGEHLRLRGLPADDLNDTVAVFRLTF